MNWKKILIDCGVSLSLAESWAGAFTEQITTKAFSQGLSEVDDFLAQVLHESGMLQKTVENLTYSTPERIQAVWPSRFPTIDSALPYVRNAEGLANRVYGGRMGNIKLGDGWAFRGRGLIMVTGRDNYRAVGDAIGVDLENNPDFLASPAVALKASIAWWEKNIPDAFIGDVTKITKRVNGGTVGLEHRTKLAALAKQALAGYV